MRVRDSIDDGPSAQDPDYQVVKRLSSACQEGDIADPTSTACTYCRCSPISITETGNSRTSSPVDPCQEPAGNGSFQLISNIGGGTTKVRNMRAESNSAQIIVNHNAGAVRIDNMKAGSGSFQFCGFCDDDYLQRYLKSHYQQQQPPRYLKPEETRDIAFRVLDAAKDQKTGVCFGTLDLNQGQEVMHYFNDKSDEKKKELDKYLRLCGLDRETSVCMELFASLLAYSEKRLRNDMNQPVLCPVWLWARRGHIFGTGEKPGIPQVTLEGMRKVIIEIPICPLIGGEWANGIFVELWKEARAQQDNNLATIISAMATLSL